MQADRPGSSSPAQPGLTMKPGASSEPVLHDSVANCNDEEYERDLPRFCRVKEGGGRGDGKCQATRPLGAVRYTRYRASTSDLSTLSSTGGLWPGLAPRQGTLIWGSASRLDAFSASPFWTWLSGGGLGRPTGTPAVQPLRSSRTGSECPQRSYARDG